MHSKKHWTVLATLLIASFLGGCEALDGANTLTPANRTEIRTAALRFTDAVGHNTDARQQTLISDDPETQQIEEVVLKDAVTSHNVQTRLAEQFGYREQDAGVVGGGAWVERMEEVAHGSPIQRAGDRAHIGPPGEAGGVFLNNSNGSWKVELIASFVSEARGRQEVSDPAVLYRFGVSQAVNQWLLGRLEKHEFPSLADYENTRDLFWINYLACTLGGKDPHNELLSTLPPLPPQALVVDER